MLQNTTINLMIRGVLSLIPLAHPHSVVPRFTFFVCFFFFWLFLSIYRHSPEMSIHKQVSAKLPPNEQLPGTCVHTLPTKMSTNFFPKQAHLA